MLTLMGGEQQFSRKVIIGCHMAHLRIVFHSHNNIMNTDLNSIMMAQYWKGRGSVCECVG